MTDLEINIALAKAMGWVETIDSRLSDASSGAFINANGHIWCLPNSQYPHQQKPFDYRDPAIFAAICKRWRLVVNFRDGFASGKDGIHVVGKWVEPQFIEKAAALVSIELAKRGVL